MLIALDYDDTYTTDPTLWDAFVAQAQARGHEVHIVTMRAPTEVVRVGATVNRIHYTDRKAKRPYMYALGLHVQIWIDDRPDFVVADAAPRSLEDNARSGLWWEPPHGEDG